MNSIVGIVIVSYHNEAMTKKYILQELPKLSIPYTIVVVNNDSTEEESKRLAKDCNLEYIADDTSFDLIPKRRGYLIWSSDNLGYAKGNNKGVNFLNLLGHFTHFLFSNDDIEIKQSNILNILVEKMSKDKNIGAIGPRVVGLDGHDQSPHDSYVSPYRMIGWKMLPFLRRKNKHNDQSDLLKPVSRFTYWVQGSFMLVNAAVFNEVGMFDENTFLYYEEPILAEKMLQIGKRMYFDSDVEIVHYEGGSTKRNPKKEKIEMESRIYYMSKYKLVNKIVLFLLKHIL